MRTAITRNKSQANFRLVAVFFWFSLSASPIAFSAGVSCAENSDHLKERRADLAKIFEEDQSDRAQFETMREEALERMVKRDFQHLKKLNQIASEKCLKTSEDYSMASKIMMHIGKPAQLLQAYGWAKKAQDLGDHSASAHITLAQSIDRYLILKGYRQLFASQAREDSEAHCWCLNSVQKDFPDSLRVEFGGRDLDGAFTWVDDLNRGLGCHIGRYCKDKLRATPKGIAPGIW